jgi:hypothetical protein
VVVYDLDTGKEFASFRGAHSAVFAPDGRTLAVRPDEQQVVVLYELASRRPWGKIVGLAAVSAVVFFLAGRIRASGRRPMP